MSIVVSDTILRSMPALLRRVLARLLRYSGLSRHIVIDRHGYRMRFFPSSQMAHIQWNHAELSREAETFAAFLKDGDTVVDVGANVGSLTLFAASLVGTTGRVIAIEAHPRTFDYLYHNLELNTFKNVTLINYALGNQEGTVSFSDLPSDPVNHVQDEGPIQVKMMTLDHVLESYALTQINLLKIDVEGFEKFVLLGSSHSLAITNCVLIETSAKNLQPFNSSVDDLFAILRDHGFKVFYIKGHPPVNALALRDTNIFSLRASELTLIPAEDVLIQYIDTAIVNS